MKKSLIASFLLCAALPAQDQEFGSTVTTTLTAVRSDPDAFRNVRVEFVVQFASLGNLSNPFFTRFTPADYMNLYAWADEQPLWQQAQFEDPFGMLFYSKQGSQLAEVFAMKPYQRLKVRGVVRNTFQSAPWIEIDDFTALPGMVDSATLTHLYRGEKFMAERQWQKAIAELTLAPGSGVPAAAQHAAFKNLGICHLRIGESDEALNCLRQAAIFATDGDRQLEHLLATATSRPSAELDRTVGQVGLKDFEKPMWDAFEQDARKAGKR